MPSPHYDGIDDLALENATLRERVAALEAENAALRDQLHSNANAGLSRVEPELAAVIEQLPVGVLIAIAPSGQLLMHNMEAIRLLGHPLLPSADYTGYAQYGALHPDGRPYTAEEYPIARALLSMRPVPFEDLIYRRGDGTLTTLAINAAPIYDDDGQLVAVVSTFHDVAYQRQLERALHESEARFAAAFSASPAAMVISTVVEGRILDTNERFLALFGRTRADVIDQRSIDLGMWVNPDDRLHAMELLRRDGYIRNWEVVVRGAGGEHRYVLLSVDLLQIGGTACLLTALYDITERVRAEAALRASVELVQERETRLRAIIENTGGVIWSIDANYRLTMANTAFVTAKQMHSGRDIQLGQQMPPDWVPEPARSELQELYTRALHGETIQDERITWTPSGDLLAWETTMNPIVDVDGHVIGVTCSRRDITARKAIEVALQRSEERYRAIVRALPDAGVLVVGPDLRYQVAEGPVLAILGFGREQMEGHTLAEVLAPETAATAGERFRRALAGEELTIERAYADRILWTRYVPLRDSAGEVRAALALILDVTERKRLEAQLLQAQKMESIGQLAGGIAHDFNNLLTAIGGYADLALSDLPPAEPVAADLGEIKRAADRAVALTRQLLAFARCQRLEMRPLDLNALVGNLEKLLRRLISEQIELVTKLSPDLDLVVADSGQIEQVLVNLVVNARDAMPDGGILTVATANVHLDPHYLGGHVDLPAGPYVLLAVSDTGLGIAPEAQAHLFEPFFTTKPLGQGTGLGLATCYGIVKQHGGTIWIYSEVGYGTVVKVYLPQGGVGVVDQNQDETLVMLPHGSETVLLAEDEPAVRALAVRVLRECGYRVLEAADGAEAVRIARTHAPEPIHLLLSDVVMPHLNGPAVAEQVRVSYPAIKVLFLSGYTGLSTTQHDADILHAPLLQKPFSPKALALAVRSALER